MLNDEQIELAAFAMYGVASNRFEQALMWVVEELVLPDGQTDYTKKQIEDYIRKALQAAQSEQTCTCPPTISRMFPAAVICEYCQKPRPA